VPVFLRRSSTDNPEVLNLLNVIQKRFHQSVNQIDIAGIIAVIFKGQDRNGFFQICRKRFFGRVIKISKAVQSSRKNPLISRTIRFFMAFFRRTWLINWLTDNLVSFLIFLMLSLLV